jgi:putative CocE/NonD family hydrolase
VLTVPPPTTDFTVERAVRVPMRDGVDLLADLYHPDTDAPAGTLLVRTPYGRTFPLSNLYGAVYAARGYHVVFQSVRGTFGSGGVFTPFVDEIADGADTVTWLRGQPWFTGSFATLGPSYLGFTQWALMVDPPPELKAAIVCVGPHDLAAATWGTGSYTINDFLGWSHGVSSQEDFGRLIGALRQLQARKSIARAAVATPAGEAARSLLGRGAPWYESWVEHPEPTDPFWAPLRVGRALDTVQIPVLLLSGWQDVFVEQTVAQYQQLRDRDVTTAMTVGPWTHANMSTVGAPTVLRETLAWLDAYLGNGPALERDPVRVHVNNHGWVDLPDWPPTMDESVLYLKPAHGLSAKPPADTVAASSFTFDPTDPTPTIGGRLLSPEGGYRDDSSLALRHDVIEFTGDPLASDLYVVGSPVAELWHSSDNPNNDVFVRVSEVDPEGGSQNVSDGFVRLTTDSGLIRLELDPIAHRFPAGSRIRVVVAGGSHPRFLRNLGTDEPPISGSRMVPATHTVHHGQGGLSRVILPAGPRLPSAD